MNEYTFTCIMFNGELATIKVEAETEKEALQKINENPLVNKIL